MSEFTGTDASEPARRRRRRQHRRRDGLVVVARPRTTAEHGAPTPGRRSPPTLGVDDAVGPRRTRRPVWPTVAPPAGVRPAHRRHDAAEAPTADGPVGRGSAWRSSRVVAALVGGLIGGWLTKRGTPTVVHHDPAGSEPARRRAARLGRTSIPRAREGGLARRRVDQRLRARASRTRGPG